MCIVHVYNNIRDEALEGKKSIPAKEQLLYQLFLKQVRFNIIRLIQFEI